MLLRERLAQRGPAHRGAGEPVLESVRGRLLANMWRKLGDSNLCAHLTACGLDGDDAVRGGHSPSRVRVYNLHRAREQHPASMCAVLCREQKFFLDALGPTLMHWQAAGYTMAGVEGGNQCFCGNGWTTPSIPPTAAPVSQCSNPCAGDSSQTCGGSWAIQIYSHVGA
jgi:hypothetical protein